MTRLVEGVGINDGTYLTKIAGKHKKEYLLWKSMLSRCYNIKVQEKSKSYIDCYVSENFKNYSYFFEWCNKQIGFDIDDYTLDKDLIFKGNKEYSENNCVFIPRALNALFIKSDSVRGELPIGVSENGSNYRARCNVSGIRKNIGTYDTPELAFNAYKTFKEAHIKELAEKYKDTIDIRAYQALLNYEVDIND